jgi:hypothetical protein
MYFDITVEKFGKKETIELIKDGSSVHVTNESKQSKLKSSEKKIPFSLSVVLFPLRFFRLMVSFHVCFIAFFLLFSHVFFTLLSV